MFVFSECFVSLRDDDDDDEDVKLKPPLLASMLVVEKEITVQFQNSHHCQSSPRILRQSVNLLLFSIFAEVLQGFA